MRGSFCYSAPLPALGQAEEMVKLVVTDRAGRTVEVGGHADISVMENIRDLNDSVDAICGGLCSCATCHVLIDPGWIEKLPPRGEEEAILVGDSANYDHERSRLSCQISLTEDLDGLTLTVAPEEF